MKKFVKVMLIIAGVFTAVGLGLSAGGVAMGATVESVEIVEKLRDAKDRFKDRLLDERFLVLDDDDDRHDDSNDDDWDEDDWDEDHMVSSDSGDGSRVYQIDSVEDVEIDLKYDELILKSYDGNTVKVEVANDSAHNVKVKSGSNSLKIESSRKKNDRSVTISYPVNMQFGDLEIDVNAGSVEIMDALEARKLEVTVGAGELSNSDSITAEEVNFEVGAGEVDVMELAADKVDGECGMGTFTMELAGKQTDYNYKLECGLGTISVGDEEFTALGGEKKINNNGAVKSMNLECGMGEISVKFSES